MHLVEILLPVTDKATFNREYAALSDELRDKFGGLTAFVRSPGEGLWEAGESVIADDIVVIEVMTPHVDVGWWKDMRARLEARLNQAEIVIRAHRIDRL